MKRSYKIIGIACLLAGAFFLQTIPNVADGEPVAPGSVNDPVITKSYLEQELQKIKQGTSATPTATPKPEPDKNQTQSAELKVLELKPGQTLYAAAGTELIVRTGKTVAVSSDENGIPDVTSGTDIAPNAAIANNHLLIFPREGRGIKPDPKSKVEIFVMVRGGYTLYNADGTMVTP